MGKILVSSPRPPIGRTGTDLTDVLFPGPHQVDEKASSIEVGRTIALLAEEGDDISNLEAPAEAPAASKKPESSEPSTTTATTGSTPPSSSSQSASSQEKQANKADTVSPKSSSHVTSSPSTASPPTGSSESEKGHGHGPTHPRGILPSVLRLLTEAGITDTAGIKATGKSGRLTKGDILVHLGRIADPSGSAKELESMSREKMEIYQVNHDGKSSKTGADAVANQKKAESGSGPARILSGDEFRRWIVAGLGNVQKEAAKPAGLSAAPLPVLGFDDILEGYVPSKKTSQMDALPPKALQGSRDTWNDILGL